MAMRGKRRCDTGTECDHDVYPSIHLFASGNMAHITTEKLDRRQTEKNSAKNYESRTQIYLLAY